MAERTARDVSRRHVLTGPVRQTVFILALPVLFEQFLSFFVGFYDTFLSGRISAEATAAVGLSAYVGWLASMLFSLVGAGTTALVSRSWGAGDHDMANRVLNRSLALATLMGLIVYALIFALAPVFVRFLVMGPEAGPLTVRYLRLDALGYLFMGLSLIGGAALRGAGDMRTPMIVLALVSVLNVAVSNAFVFGIGPFPQFGLPRLVPRLGIDGIVIGTVAARTLGGLLTLYVLVRGVSGLQGHWREFSLRGQTVRRILKIGIPAALDGALMWAGQFLFLMIIARLGADPAEAGIIMAAHFIGIRVEAITYLPAVAWGYAAATMVGQALGAQNHRRALQSGHEAVRQAALFGAVLAVVFFVFARAIYALMHSVPAVADVGVPAFRVLAWFQVPLVISIVYVFALRGAGDTRFSMWATAVSVFGVRLPAAWFFGLFLGGGLLGAWTGMFLDLTLRAGLVWWRFRRSRWMEVR